MKRKTLIILSFLLLLYIVPSILTPSSSIAARQNNPNTTRDYSPSEYGDESSQSITSFSETLADDVLFFPENESHGSGYAENFTDVSDWTVTIGSAPTSDGDLIELKPAADGAFDKIYTNAVSMTNDLNYYYEFRAKANATSTTYVQFYGYESDGATTTSHIIADLLLTTSWITRKGIITHNGALESISCLYKSSVASLINVDYLRISPSNELGWQHDGSTTAGISSIDEDDEVTTDGDNVTLISDNEFPIGATFEVLLDNTTTQASLSTAYYSFLVVKCTSVSEGDGWNLQQYDGSAWATLQATYVTTSGTYRYNMASLDTYVQKLRLNITRSAVISFDYLKAYSIANFTYTSTGVSLDDYLYVSSDVLYCAGTSFTSIVLDHDPALANTYYAGWNMSTSQGTPQIDFYVGAWLGYSSETSGELPLGTLTDTRVKFTASANIISIKFIDLHDWHIIGTAILEFDMPNWHIIATAIINFWTAMDTTYLDWLLIFLGLIMIPASTLYLVKGGKDGMSANKFFYFVVAFMLGWGLLLGGIM